MDTKTINVNFGKGQWHIEATIDKLYAENDKAVIIFMGLGGASDSYDKERLAKWKTVYLKYGYDVITFNNKKFINYLLSKKSYWTPEILLKLHFSVIKFSIKKMKYDSLILNGWSSGAITLYEAQKSKYSKYIKATIYNDPSLTVGGVETHMKKMHNNIYSISEAKKISNTFKKYFPTTQQSIDSFGGSIFIIYAEHNYDFIMQNSHYLRQSSKGIYHLKNADHGFRFWKATNKTDIEFENRKIWDEYISYLEDILVKTQ